MSALNYSLLMPGQIVFGWGRRSELGRLAAPLGRRALLITGSQSLQDTGRLAELQTSLTAAGLSVEVATAPRREPEVADVDALVQSWRQKGITGDAVVIAVGGGSTIDLAKAAAAIVTNPQAPSVADFLEGVGTGATLNTPPLPMVAVPTTAGTGSEATKNAVISSYAPLFKKSLRSDQMIPRCVLVDPELTVTVPPRTTAYTGMDAITQLLESYLSRRAAPIPQALCLQGLQLALPALATAVHEGTNQSAREAMSHAALLSGIALANSGLGLAHGVAAALGVHARVPHGLACAVMLVPTLKFNLACREAAMAELARRVLSLQESDDHAAACRLIEHIEQLCREIEIPTRLREVGVSQSQIPALVPASRGNSLSGNPRDVSDTELQQLLETLW